MLNSIRYSPTPEETWDTLAKYTTVKAAGSGKTYTLLITALRFMVIPKSTGCIFRRTSKMLDAPGSIWSEAVNMYTTVFPKIRIKHREHEIIFENGSVLKFSHMQHESNAYDHKGRHVPL